MRGWGGLLRDRNADAGGSPFIADKENTVENRAGRESFHWDPDKDGDGLVGEQRSTASLSPSSRKHDAELLRTISLGRGEWQYIPPAVRRTVRHLAQRVGRLEEDVGVSDTAIGLALLPTRDRLRACEKRLEDVEQRVAESEVRSRMALQSQNSQERVEALQEALTNLARKSAASMRGVHTRLKTLEASREPGNAAPVDADQWRQWEARLQAVERQRLASGDIAAEHAAQPASTSSLLRIDQTVASLQSEVSRLTREQHDWQTHSMLALEDRMLPWVREQVSRELGTQREPTATSMTMAELSGALQGLRQELLQALERKADREQVEARLANRPSKANVMQVLQRLRDSLRQEIKEATAATKPTAPAEGEDDRHTQQQLQSMRETVEQQNARLAQRLEEVQQRLTQVEDRVGSGMSDMSSFLLPLQGSPTHPPPQATDVERLAQMDALQARLAALERRLAESAAPSGLAAPPASTVEASWQHALRSAEARLQRELATKADLTLVEALYGEKADLVDVATDFLTLIREMRQQRRQHTVVNEREPDAGAPAAREAPAETAAAADPATHTPEPPSPHTPTRGREEAASLLDASASAAAARYHRDAQFASSASKQCHDLERSLLLTETEALETEDPDTILRSIDDFLQRWRNALQDRTVARAVEDENSRGVGLALAEVRGYLNAESCAEDGLRNAARRLLHLVQAVRQPGDRRSGEDTPEREGGGGGADSTTDACITTTALYNRKTSRM